MSDEDDRRRLLETSLDQSIQVADALTRADLQPSETGLGCIRLAAWIAQTFEDPIDLDSFLVLCELFYRDVAQGEMLVPDGALTEA